MAERVVIAPYEGSQHRPGHVDDVRAGVVIAPYEGSQRVPEGARLRIPKVVIAPYEGSQRIAGVGLVGDLLGVVIAPYEGSQLEAANEQMDLLCQGRHSSLRGIATASRRGRPGRSRRQVVIAPYEGSQQPIRSETMPSTREVVIAPYEGSQPAHLRKVLDAERVVIAPYEGSQHLRHVGHCRLPEESS